MYRVDTCDGRLVYYDEGPANGPATALGNGDDRALPPKPEPVQRLPRLDVTHSRNLVARFVRSQGRATRHDVTRHFGCSNSMAQQRLAELVMAGRLEVELGEATGKRGQPGFIYCKIGEARW